MNDFSRADLYFFLQSISSQDINQLKLEFNRLRHDVRTSISNSRPQYLEIIFEKLYFTKDKKFLDQALNFLFDCDIKHNLFSFYLFRYGIDSVALVKRLISAPSSPENLWIEFVRAGNMKANESIKFLLKNKLINNINYSNDDYNALHFAIGSRQNDLISLLLAAGADPNLINYKEETAVCRYFNSRLMFDKKLTILKTLMPLLTPRHRDLSYITYKKIDPRLFPLDFHSPLSQFMESSRITDEINLSINSSSSFNKSHKI